MSALNPGLVTQAPRRVRLNSSEQCRRFSLYYSKPYCTNKTRNEILKETRNEFGHETGNEAPDTGNRDMQPRVRARGLGRPAAGGAGYTSAGEVPLSQLFLMGRSRGNAAQFLSVKRANLDLARD